MSYVAKSVFYGNCISFGQVKESTAVLLNLDLPDLGQWVIHTIESSTKSSLVGWSVTMSC